MIKVTAKISIALDKSDNFIKIEDAIRGEKYYCVNCKEALFPSKGNKNIHHYRHYNKKDTVALQECELYSAGESEYGVLMNEKKHENHTRFIIDDTFKLKIKLPFLESSSFARMNFDDSYFTVEVCNFSVFSTDLGRESIKRLLEVPFKEEYFINISGDEDVKKNVRILNYQIEDKIVLMVNDVLIFKKIGEHYINIPYTKTNLSEVIFLLSSRALILHEDLFLYKYEEISDYHLYYILVEELTDSLIEWFKKETSYIIIPNRKWIDIVSPVVFQYSDESLLIEEEHLMLSVTATSKRDIISITRDDNIHKDLSPNEINLFNMTLELNHTYNIKLKNEIANELIIKRVEGISPKSSYIPTVFIDEENFNITNFGEFPDKNSHIESDLDFYIYFKNSSPFRVKEISNQSPNLIHFPFIGTAHQKSKVIKIEDIISQILYSRNSYIIVRNNEYRKVLEHVRNTNISNKSIILKLLLQNYNKLPKEIIDYIRRGEY